MNTILNNQIETINFETAYVAVRNAEHRLYTDAEVLQLPEIERSHLHFKEWKIRKKSSLQLIHYLKKKNKPLKILEIGCGNGWLAAKLSAIHHTKITALDTNQIEIEQAKRIFKNSNLQFIYSSFPTQILASQKFDIIVFAASFQYFPSVANVINNCHEYLAIDGEIHIIDTNFYPQNKIGEAAERTKSYYNKIGQPEMAGNYFHHSIKDFEPFNYRIKIKPNNLWNRLYKKHPFYWVMVKYTSPR